MSRPHPVRIRAARHRTLGLAAVVVALFALAGPGVATARSQSAVTPPAGLTLEATVLLDGHARVGAWLALDVHLRNDGPAIQGEVRISGGTQGRTRFGTVVDLPTGSEKTYRLYAQTPGFGREVELSLDSGGTTIATTKAAFVIHQATQLAVGIVAERPGPIVGDLDLPPDANNVAPLTVALDVADLPDRVEAWGTLDRLIWQDTDSSRLEPDQLDALRGWVAAGGRLVIVGGTTGPATLSAFPEQLLPYRPTATIDAAPASLRTLLGVVPDDATDLPALAGDAVAGASTLATVGDRVIAAERAYGSGTVAVVGFDPTAEWISGTRQAEGLWRRLIPTRSATSLSFGDDSNMISAAGQLPLLALPPVGGLIALLGGYILLIGPVNYLVLRRLDRREWAWVTMPALIVAFAAGSYGIGSFLRGSDLIINEVAIVRGAPGTTDGLAQSYLGVFSPTRASYQLRVPGGALLSAPISGDFFGGDGNAATLDVLQGDPARVRDLAVGFGTLRTVRAESAATVPLVESDLRVEDGRLRGSIRNASDEPLLQPAVVLGGAVAKLDDLAPGASAEVDVALQPGQFGQPLSDRVVGPIFFDGPRAGGDDGDRLYARHTIIDQLTYDPNWGSTGQLPAEGAVILAWSDRPLVPVEIEGEAPRRTANVLWFLPTDVSIRGRTTFRNDLLRNTIVSTDAAFFNKDPFNISFGQGTAELSYRPIGFDGTLEVSELAIGFNFGDPGFAPQPKPAEPLAEIPVSCATDPGEGCVQPSFDGLPELELFDRVDGAWRRFEHLQPGTRIAVVDPQRYVDPGTGTVLVRLINEHQEGVGFSLDMAITGEVR